ncbi:hypothetical protein LCGC14_0865190 [marine sediment metagenome]|uniref:Uncharacterized protein n=1 Tax=marine sediment metagenome TaxID=412755 RepID=A0A0F9RQZ0_9ZZZZ
MKEALLLALKWDDGPGSFSMNHGLNVGSANNFTEIQDDGTVRFEGTAQQWDDVRIVPGAFEFAGASDPSLQNWQPGGSGTTFKIYKFKEDDEVFFTVQMPHNWKEGSDIQPHVHWTPCDRGNEENLRVVVWELHYSWANEQGGIFAPASSVTMADICTGFDDVHLRSPAGTISGAGKTMSSMLVCRLSRSAVGDTWVGTTNAQSPALLEFDIHFQIDGIGSNSIDAK